MRIDTDTVWIDVMQTGPLGVNTYIVRRSGGSECVVIDPADGERVLGFLANEGLSCKAVLLTHCHFDHILGVQAMQAAGAGVYIGAPDAPGLNDRAVNMCPMYLSGECGPFEGWTELKDRATVEEAGLRFEVIFTPGHTAGGVCYLLREADAIFAGDTLFRRGIGRYDLPGGDAVTLYESIRDRLFALEGDHNVFPGHGGATTLEEERRGNLYMQMDPLRW